MNTPPPAPAVSAYDSHDGYVLILGEPVQNGGGPPQTWMYRAGNYTQLHPSNAPSDPNMWPPGSYAVAMAYDAAGGFVLMVDATTSPLTTWEYAAGEWQLIAEVSAPSGWATHNPSLTFDSHDGYVLYTGGSAPAPVFTWKFSGGAWQNLTATAGSPNFDFGTVAISDDPDDGYVLAVGAVSTYPGSPAVWTFAAGMWSSSCVSCGPGAYGQPDGLLVSDPNLGGMLYLSPGRQTWSWSGGNWTEVYPAQSPCAVGESLTFDPVDNYTLMFGGQSCFGSASFIVNGSWWFGRTPVRTYSVVVSALPASDGLVDFGRANLGIQPIQSPTTLNLTNGTYPLSPLPSRDLNTRQVWAQFGGWSTSGSLSISGGNLTVSGGGGSVTANFQPFPWVQFSWSGCGPVILNRTAYANGYGNFLPALGPYPLSASACSAYSFSAWGTSGGVSVTSLTANVTTAEVTANGTLGAEYTLVGEGPVIDLFGMTSLPAPSDPSTMYVDLGVSGGVAPYLITYAGLPPGCTSRSEEMWSCAPTATGTFYVTAAVRDASGGWASTATIVTIASLAALPLAVGPLTAAPSPDPLGEPVVFTTNVSGGSPPFEFSYSGLPNGCSSTDQAVFSCTPTALGTFIVVVTVTDSHGNSGMVTTQLTVAGAPGGGLPTTEIGVLILGGAVAVTFVGWVLYRGRRSGPSGPP